MKRIRWAVIPILFVLTATVLSPASVFASPYETQNGNVIASAVVVPVKTAELGFTITAQIKEVNVKEGDVVTAGQTLATLNTPDLEYSVIAAAAAYRSAAANAELQRYKRVKDFRNGKIFWDIVPPEVRRIADAQELSAKSALEAAQATLAQGTLISPYNATVISVNASTGEVVQAGQVAVTIATLDNLVIETTDLSERDITKVGVGAPVQISVEPLNEVFTGKVVSIAPRATVVGGDVVFKVTITFDRQPKGLLWGMTAEVTIGI